MNNVKHKEILDSMVEKGMIDKSEQAWGSKIIIKYNISQKGASILREILEPYEELFPRSSNNSSSSNSNGSDKND